VVSETCSQVHTKICDDSLKKKNIQARLAFATLLLVGIMDKWLVKEIVDVIAAFLLMSILRFINVHDLNVSPLPWILMLMRNL
jgi:hypothetical protein